MHGFRAALYHRVSTIDQDPTLAREELRRAAAQRDLVVVLDVEETGSGARNDRPGLRRVVEAAQRGDIDVVLAWKLDRVGRSALDLLATLRTLDDAGVRFVATSQGIDIRPGGDPMGRLLITMLAAVAEFERELIVERTRLGIAKARRRGKQLGRRRNRDAPDPARVAAMRAAGASWTAIAGQLHCSTGAARRVALLAAQTPAGKGPPAEGGKDGEIGGGDVP
jgi:DNA invertase Pin-like site-specific DNA recombinase